MKKNHIKKFCLTLILTFAVFSGLASGQEKSDISVKFSAALANLKEKNYEAVITKTTEILEVSPKFSECFMLRGMAYYYTSEHTKAVDDFSSALKLTLTPDTKKMAYRMRAVNYLKLKKYAEVVEDMTIVIDSGTDDFRDYGFRGMSYLYTGKDQAAVNDFDKVLQASPQEKSMYGFRGQANLNLGNYEKAVSDTTTEIDRNPQNSNAYKTRAAAYRRLGKNELADVDEAKFVELGGTLTNTNEGGAKPKANNDKQVNDAKIRTIVENVLKNVKAKNFDLAIKYADELIKLYPDKKSFQMKSLIYATRGIDDYSNGDYEKSLENFNEAIKIDDTLDLAYLARAKVYRKMGKVKEAEADEAKAAELKPKE